MASPDAPDPRDKLLEKKRPPSEASHRAPSISLPKGGGALKAIDEKFSVNPVNGTSSLSIPLPFSQSRGSTPAMALQYSSGSGNGPFGLGWNIDSSSIARRTDKALPRYRDGGDGDEADVFLLSGAEDLVPAWRRDGGGNWEPDQDSVGAVTIRRYRPRSEGGFARIEHIIVAGQPGSYWKVTSRNNVATVYGLTPLARLADPTDPTRIYKWLPELVYDDKGNCHQFHYKAETLERVTLAVEESHRLNGVAPCANVYLKRISYGNKTPYYPDPATPWQPAPPAAPAYFFEAVFDYGEHDEATPAIDDAGVWPCRADPFSEHRAGFEVRSWRLCRRILFFHRFAELSAPGPGQPCLVQSIDLAYRHMQFAATPGPLQEADQIIAISHMYYRREGAGYQRKSYPALALDYHPVAWDRRVHNVGLDDMANAPAGASGAWQFSDLYGEGVPGILTEQASAWYYKSNLGDGHFSRAFSVVPKPSFTGIASGALQLQDLDADGGKQVVVSSPGLAGYFELDDQQRWLPFRQFRQVPNTPASDPNARYIDLDGDGRPDLLVTEDVVLRWYPSQGREGYGAPQECSRPLDEDLGPAFLFADGSQSLHLADMSGDGLADIVRVRSSDVCYWPNLGYGRFGPKVTMRDAPLLGYDGSFDPAAVRLFDISGTGASDLIYLGGGGFRAWINLAGNGWSAAQDISPFPGTEQPNKVTVVDLLGNGTGCLVWSSGLPANATSPMRYVDLMGGKKPFILRGYRNNLGSETRLEYRSSSYYYLNDQRLGRPWACRLPFPSMCVSLHETFDRVSGARFVHEYRYRHGYYDHAEREFRGFGMVEQLDTEDFVRFAASGASNVVDATIHQAPVRTRSWYHTGAYIDGAGLLDQFAKDYYVNAVQPEHALPDALIEDIPAGGLTPEEQRQAARACKGMLLRREIYADDGLPESSHPFSTAQHNCRLRLLQPQFGNRHAVFMTHESEAVSYHYERNPADPRIGHTLNTVIDNIGNVLEAFSVAYPRVASDATLPIPVQEAQGALTVQVEVKHFTNDVATPSSYRLRQLCESRSYELTGAAPAATFFTLDELHAASAGALALGYEQAPHAGLVERRLLGQQRTLFVSDADPHAALPLGQLQALGMVHAGYSLAFTPSLLASLYGARVDAAMLAEGGYHDSAALKGAGLFPATDPDQHYWAASGTVEFAPNPEQHFYLPVRFIDPLGTVTTVRYYADYHLLVDRTEDALGNRTHVDAFDFRFLQPVRSRDINNNISDAVLDIFGLVAATAVLGKGAEADDLLGLQADLSEAQIAAFLADPETTGAALLQHATARFVYDMTAVPAVSASITRETHHRAALASGVPSKLQFAFEYSDGGGRIAMKKLQAEPGLAKQVTVAPDGSYTVTDVDTTPRRRWIGNGRTVQNNKGKPVLQYEPYFSVTPAYETAPELVESGVSPVRFYDAAGRCVRTVYPNGSSIRVQFDHWRTITFDQNDNLLGSDWYNARIGGALGLAEQRAAQQTLLHDSTPSQAHADARGGTVYTVGHNKFIDRTTAAVVEQFLGTRTDTDIEGNVLALHDARGNVAMRYAYDMTGHQAFSASMDAGERRTLLNVMGSALHGWDAKGNRFHSVYDVLHRPVRQEVLDGAAVLRVTERILYGTDPALNQNGLVVQRYDPAGLVTCDAHDFAGNLRVSTRTFCVAPDLDPDWSNIAAVPLEPLGYTSLASYDALKRVTEATAPDGSVTRDIYNESNLLTRLEVGIRGAPPQPFILAISHDAKGQRSRIDYGNGASTEFSYDPLTFAVRRLRTMRSSDGATLQDLRYTYDPVGNICAIADNAQQDVYFNNAVVGASGVYVYDALYRLVSATGREQIGLNRAPDAHDQLRTHLPHRADGAAVQNYLQQFEYDAVGNLNTMAHAAGSGIFVNRWTRQFTLDAASNRLAESTVSGVTETFLYDVHGNMTRMPHLASMEWGVDDELRGADLGGGGHAYYQYDADGSRVRKVVRRAGAIVEERLYLGALEIFRRSVAGVKTLERASYHVLDRDRRLAMVDTLVEGDDGSVAQLTRYQFSNHLGGASLELDHAAAIISYEEYYPFGSTSFQSVDSAREVPAKRYRYTGKERDEESGLYYQGKRYYAPWLARWTAADPAGVKDGPNRYQYAGNRPIGSSDPTGMWEWPSLRTVAIVAAVVVVSVAVTVVTAGLAGPVIAGAAASVFGAGTVAATVATGVVVGAVAGAAGGAAGELTRQVLSGEEVSGARIGRAAVSGAIGGALTGGIGAATGALAGGVGAAGRAARTASVAARSAAVPRTATQVVTRAAQGAAIGATGSAAGELGAQAIVDRQIDLGRVGWAAASGAGIGAGVGAASPTFAPVLGGSATRGGVRLADVFFGRGSVGSTAAAMYAAERGISLAPSRGPVPPNAVNVDTGSAVALTSEATATTAPRAGSPVLPVTDRASVEAIVAGRPTVMTRSAVTEFQTNARSAGPLERANIFDFLARTRIIADAPNPAVSGLRTSGSIGIVDRIIFGTGQTRGLPTMTTDNFGSAASAQGVTISPPPIVHISIPFGGL